MSGRDNMSRDLYSQKQPNGRRRAAPPPALKLQSLSEEVDSSTSSLQEQGPESYLLPTLAGTTCPTTQANLHPKFFDCLSHLAQPLVPLVSLSNGLAHADFPRSILGYHLLTNEQLDDLARHYHQVWPPVPETFGYPMRIPAWIGTADEADVDIETKRRRIGRFAGLRGCESPPVTTPTGFGLSGQEDESAMADDLEERMEKEWQDALRRARWEDDPDTILRRKAGGF